MKNTLLKRGTKVRVIDDNYLRNFDFNVGNVFTVKDIDYLADTPRYSLQEIEGLFYVYRFERVKNKVKKL